METFTPVSALVGLTFGPGRVFVFVAAMVAGMAIFRLVRATWPRMALRRGVPSLDG